jgi:UDP-N-acetylmuramyl pentapeptide phosphotransferase/UDP-N-acetylglucosamine-1-phosphate transferase
MDAVIYEVAISALTISLLFTPILLWISRKKGFYASINHRSSHDTFVPNTGGIILFIAVLFPLIVFSGYPEQEDFNLLISAFVVLLITGVIDDFNPIPVTYKFLGQFVPAVVIVTSIDEPDLLIPFLNDLVRLPYIFNYLFWIIFIVMTINAFNLIDGIDGLAIGLGTIIGLFYFVHFYQLGAMDPMIFSIALSFGLVGLFFYNISDRLKIFLGDTGSLLIGGLLVFFALRFISLSETSPNYNSFFLVIGAVFVPMADMVRVTIVRIIKGYSPFHADRRHIHHILLDLIGGSHMLTTAILLLAQLLIMVIFQLFSGGTSPFLFIVLIISLLCYIACVAVLDMIKRRKIMS